MYLVLFNILYLYNNNKQTEIMEITKKMKNTIYSCLCVFIFLEFIMFNATVFTEDSLDNFLMCNGLIFGLISMIGLLAMAMHLSNKTDK